jgi:23S rRNA U2552 (ribose-2'-O)-methylase RlmE/FtsJ
MERFLLVDGIIAAQTPKTAEAFKSILPNFKTIIEIGFHRGAFSLWLLRNKQEGSKLVSYDISFDSKQVDDVNLDFRKGDCFDERIINEIQELILNGGKTLVLCDGGHKDREFNLYSKFLKEGDVIMCHDYAHSNEEYDNITKSINWNTAAESRFDNIKDSVELYSLEGYLYDTFKNVLWGSFIKK